MCVLFVLCFWWSEHDFQPSLKVSYLPAIRSLPPSHHYDNESEGASAAPVYSSVKPRAKPQTMLVSSTPIYDIAMSANQKPGEGLSSPHNGEYELVQGNKGEGKVDVSVCVHAYEWNKG